MSAGGRAVVHQRAVAQRHDARAIALRQADVVQADDHRHAVLAVERRQESITRRVDSRVQRGDGLVGQHQPRALHQRAGDRGALLLAARQRGGALEGLWRQADRVERVERARLFRQREAAQQRAPQRQRRRPGRSARCVSTGRRPTRLNCWKMTPTCARSARMSRLMRPCACSERPERPRSRPVPASVRLQPAQAAQQGRLAGARGAEQRDALAAAYFQADATQRRGPP